LDPVDNGWIDYIRVVVGAQSRRTSQQPRCRRHGHHEKYPLITGRR